MKQTELTKDYCSLCDEELEGHGNGTLQMEGKSCVCVTTSVYPLSPYALVLYYTLAFDEAG